MKKKITKLKKKHPCDASPRRSPLAFRWCIRGSAQSHVSDHLVDELFICR